MDAVQWLRGLPPDTVDMVLTSPPYEDCRTYGLPPLPQGQAWVDWMVDVVRAASPVCRGPIFVVVEGKTRKFKYSATPFLLMADLHRAGFNLRKPCIYQRHGIPGSGGPDWLKNRWEPVICVTRPGKLPYFDLSEIGHAPKYAPGGEMSHRLPNDARVNGKWKLHSSQTVSPGEVETIKKDYKPPKFANPGNIFVCQDETLTIDCGACGGGRLGSQMAHENEAPFPEKLADPLIRTFCPVGGTVADPFSGSGTTIAVATKLGRIGIGCDIRVSQVELTKRRLLEAC